MEGLLNIKLNALPVHGESHIKIKIESKFYTNFIVLNRLKDGVDHFL